MTNSKIATLSLDKGNVSKENYWFEEGKTYYFQFRAYVDIRESGAGCWVGKRKVKIVKGKMRVNMTKVYSQVTLSCHRIQYNNQTYVRSNDHLDITFCDR